MPERRTFMEIREAFDAWDDDPAHWAWTTDPELRAERKKLEEELNDWYEAHARGEC